jgi:hypothetical protein
MHRLFLQSQLFEELVKSLRISYTVPNKEEEISCFKSLIFSPEELGSALCMLRKINSI